MSDVYEIIEKLSREVCELHSDNQRLRARVEELERLARELAEGDASRDEITRLRAGLQRIVEGDGFWDAPSLARDLLEGKDVT